MVTIAAAPLKIELFGTMRVQVEGEPLPRLRSRKAVWLLALLALRDGRPASRQWVATTLWPDTDASIALANLRPVMSELRRALGSQKNRVQSVDRNSVVLDLSNAFVDTIEFDRAVREGRHERAAELYRGSLLEGCPEEWCLQERNVRQLQCIETLLKLGEDALLAERHLDGTIWFMRARGMDSWRDAPVRGLMKCLVAAGDLNAALQSYREFAQALSREAGLAPDRETTALYERLRARTTETKVPEQPAEPRQTPNNLVRPLTKLIGREDERLDVPARLRRTRLVTLSGVGGIGKTQLALAVCHDLLTEYPGGVWFAALDRLSDEKGLIQALAAEIGVQEEFLDGIVERLQDRRTLLVLDNCEHLIGACRDIATTLIQRCGELRILATSREALGVPGEEIWPVPSLDFPDLTSLPHSRATRLRVVDSYESVRLFVDRAQAVQPKFSLTSENLDGVVDICAQLHGIPLAIELAAARTRSMSIGTIVEHLRSRQLEVLQSRNRGLPDRQATMRATLDWSHDLLDSEEKRVLRRVSVFVAGWPFAAAEAVAGPGTRDFLDSLIDKCLVIFDGNSDRYRMLETVRQYAAEQLRESGEFDSICLLHRTWFLDFAERGSAGMGGEDQGLWLRRLSQEHGNLLGAMEGFATSPNGGIEGLRIAGALWKYWNIRGPRSEGRECLQRALNHPGADGETAERGRALNGAGALAYHAGDRIEAKPLFEAALKTRLHVGDKRGAASSLTNLAVVLMSDGEVEGAQAAYEKCLSIARELKDESLIAVTLLNTGYLLLSHLGELAEARDRYERALGSYRNLGDASGVAFSTEGLGFVALAMGDFEAARGHFEEAMSIRQGLEDQDVAWPLEYLGEVALSRGELAIAQDYLEKSLALFMKTAEREGIAASTAGLACVSLARGDFHRARSQFEEALRLFRLVGERVSVCRTLCYLGVLSARSAEFVEAERLLRECLALAQEIRAPNCLTQCLEAFAELLSRGGDYERAMCLWGAADRERERTGERRRLHDESEEAVQKQLVRTALGEPVFDAFWDRGRSMTLDEAAGTVS